MHQKFLALAWLAVVPALWACGGSSPITPTPTPEPTLAPSLPATLSGVWRGYIKAADCVPTINFCREVMGPFVLRALETDGGYVASLELNPDGLRIVMNAKGVLQSDGAVLFTGTRGPIDRDPYRVELRRFLVRTDQGAGLAGEIELSRIPTGGGSTSRLEGRILSAEYAPLPAPSPEQMMSGSWSGRVVVRACSGDCQLTGKGDELDVALVLRHTGNEVSGQIRGDWSGCSSLWLPVSGSASGSHVSFSSERYVSPPGGTCRSVKLEDFQADLDSLGRLTGRLVVSSNWRMGSAFEPESQRIECRIQWLNPD